MVDSQSRAQIFGQSGPGQSHEYGPGSELGDLSSLRSTFVVKIKKNPKSWYKTKNIA